MSSYDQHDQNRVDHGQGEYIPVEEFRSTMALMRLQNAIPISVLVSLGTGLICSLVVKPNMGEISLLHPTLLTPNNLLVGIYWAVLYALQVGFCLMVTLVRNEDTKDILIHGVGIRFAAANWLMTGWTVCWTLQLFTAAEILMVLNVAVVLSIHVTLLRTPPTWHHPFVAVFVHGMISLFLAVLLDLHLPHGGTLALDFVIEHRKERTKYTWPIVGVLIGLNTIQVIWEVATRSFALAFGAEYILLCYLLSTPRVNPNLPESAMPKPAPLIITIIVFLVLHPLALGASLILHRQLQQEGRIRLEEEVGEAEERARIAEERAQRAESRGHHHSEPAPQ